MLIKLPLVVVSDGEYDDEMLKELMSTESEMNCLVNTDQIAYAIPQGEDNCAIYLRDALISEDEAEKGAHFASILVNLSIDELYDKII